MTITKSSRGFKQGSDIPSDYGGFIRVYESSAAMWPHIWVRIECPANLNEPSGPTIEAVAHLPLEEARQLRNQLTELIDRHYQHYELNLAEGEQA